MTIVPSETKWEPENWIGLSEYKVPWRLHGNTLMKLWVP
jgi:hypothetical protein